MSFYYESSLENFPAFRTPSRREGRLLSEQMKMWEDNDDNWGARSVSTDVYNGRVAFNP